MKFRKNRPLRPEERWYRAEQEQRRHGYTHRYRRSNGVTKVMSRIVIIIISVYLIIAIGGSLKVQEPYDMIYKFTLVDDSPVQFVEKNFFDHMKVMLLNPSEAWHYIISDEEIIYTELMIEYGRASGQDTSELEAYLAMYKLLN